MALIIEPLPAELLSRQHAPAHQVVMRVRTASTVSIVQKTVAHVEFVNNAFKPTAKILKGECQLGNQMRAQNIYMRRIFLLLLTTCAMINCYAQTSQEHLKKGLAKANSRDYRGAIKDYGKAIA